MIKPIVHKAAIAILALSLMGISAMAEAQRPMARVQDRPQADARGGRNAVTLVPYGEVARRVVKRFGGRVVGQRVNEAGGRITYEIRLLRKNGRVVFVTVDAKSGKILRTRGE